jgi:hypothetical protein
MFQVKNDGKMTMNHICWHFSGEQMMNHWFSGVLSHNLDNNGISCHLAPAGKFQVLQILCPISGHTKFYDWSSNKPTHLGTRSFPRGLTTMLYHIHLANPVLTRPIPHLLYQILACGWWTPCPKEGILITFYYWVCQMCLFKTYV